jgi:hypothetical protein
MSDDGRPLLRLPPPRSFARKKRAPKIPQPEIDAPRHGAALARGLANVLAHQQLGQQRAPSLATDVPYVRVAVREKAFVTDQELEGIGLIPVYRREDAVLAAYSPDAFGKFSRKLELYTEQEKHKLFGKIADIGAWQREDRLSDRLREMGQLDADRLYVVDVLLMPLETASAHPHAVRRIRDFLRQHGGVILDQAQRPAFTALRARAHGRTIDTLLDYRDDIALVDLPPSAQVLVPAMFSLDLDDVGDVPPPPDGAPGVCVIDSGILEGHPLLESAVVGEHSRSFPESLGPPVPSPPIGEARHGTHVAGVALYGDVGAAVHAGKFEPSVWIYNARILDDDNRLPEDRMPLVEEVVDHIGARCRVFNLSVGLDSHPGYLSIPAAELDDLTRSRDVLFVVSSGNQHLHGFDPPAYPECLYDAAARVQSPGEALSVLTVGGITPDRNPFKEGRRLVAPRLAKSPFSCSGGLKGVVKPELVEVAGNLVIDEAARRLAFDPGVGVPTLGTEVAAGRLIAVTRGTSMAAPRVARLAAHVFARRAGASTNLVRALLVQSARLPSGAEGSGEERLRLYGFGVPDLDRALFSRRGCATLIYEGVLAVDEVKIFEIPVPPDVMAARGRKIITVTVAYDPPVSVARRDRPAGITLRWEIARGDVPDAVIRAKIASEEEDAGAATWTTKGGKPKAVFLQWKALPRRPQRRGTISKSVFEWKRKHAGESYSLAIIARATRPGLEEEQQRFAVVVSVECGDESVNVYQAVRARLAAGRVRVRVPR